MATSKEISSKFWWNNPDDNSDSDSKDNLLAKTAEEDNNFVDSDLEEDPLSPKTSEEDSSWEIIPDHNMDSDSQEDLSAKTSDDETSWVKVIDHNVDSDFQEDDHSTDFGLKEDLPLKKSTSLEKNTPPPPEFDISGFFNLPDKSPRVLHKSDTQSSQILELKEDKRYAEYSYVEGGTHSCNFVGQIYKKLKFKDNESLKDVIKMHALPFLPAKSVEGTVSPRVLHKSDPQSSQILELKEDKRYAEYSYVEGGTHSCNFVGQISKKLKFKDNESLKDVIKMHALPLLPAKSVEGTVSPRVLHKSDTQSSQILELKEDKRYAEYSYVEGGTHSCNFVGQISKKLKFKDNESLKDVIKMHALPFLPAKSVEGAVSPRALHKSDPQSSQILELKEDKRYAEYSYVEGGTHSCNFVGQISKKLKFKDNESLKDVIKMHALPFLPAKSLCRFRSVCKAWDERINHPFLAHQQTNQFKDISGLLCQSPFLAPSFVNFDRDAYGIPSPRFSFLPDHVNVKSTCNGLVCCQCFDEVDVYYVCNPVTEKWTKLPQPKLFHGSQTVATLAFEPTAFGFAAHYQLVCAVADVLSDPPVVYFEIYSSRTNTWRVSETVCYEADALTLSNDGFYVNGNVYWKTLSGVILTFHLYFEHYSIGKLPPNHGPQGALTHLHGELCYVLPAIVDNECIISIYGNLDMSLKYEITLLQNMSGMYCQALPSVNGEMLMILLDKGVIAYHVKTEKVEFLSKERMQGYQTILPYINTLVGIATPSSKELETVAY